MDNAIEFRNLPDGADENILEVRDALFTVGDGKTLNVVMMGTLMAQGKLIASVIRDPDQARNAVDNYYSILRDAMDAYCREVSH